MNQNPTTPGTTRTARTSFASAATWALLAAVVPAASLVAQQTESSAPVAPDASRPIAAWVEDLGADDVEVRKAAEKALASRGAAAVEALEDAAESHSDPEVQWRARRVLRRIRAGSGDGGLRPRGVTPERAEEEVPNRPGASMDLTRVIEEMRAQMEEMRRRVGAMSGGVDLDLLERVQRSTQSSTSVQIGPDGVRVEVKETGEDGEPVTRVYEAESMEALKEQHPEIGGRIGFGIGGIDGKPFQGLELDMDVFSPGGIRVDPRGVDIQPFELKGLPPGGLRPWTSGAPSEAPQDAPPSDGERLGIYVGDLAPEVRDFLEIEAGLGLLVASVEEGSLGTELGLRAKDVVLRIADRDIRSTADVRAALRGVAKGERVVVEVNRMGASKLLEAKKRHDAPKAGLRRG
jgi:hypothetical protein